MLPNKQVEIDELFNRLFSADPSETTEDIFTDWRRGLAEKRAKHTRQMAELANLATYRVARVEQLEAVDGGPWPRERIAEVVTVLQSELPAFAKSNGLKIDELKSALNNTRKEAVNSNGTKFRAYPLLYHADSVAGNKEAQETWRKETAAEEKYLAKRKKEGHMEYKPTPETVHTTFGGLK